MNPSQDSLSKHLRELAAAAPQDAPPELGDRLRHAFARHHSRRRRIRIALATGLLLLLVASVAWLRLSYQSHPKTAATQAPRTAQPAATTADAGASVPARAIAHAPARKLRSKTAVKARVAHSRPRPDAVVADDDFVALPLFNPAIPIGQARMVRMELPGSALQLIGFPVNEELLERHVLTDVLVGQDGVPYAVRLVRTRSTH